MSATDALTILEELRRAGELPAQAFEVAVGAEEAAALAKALHLEAVEDLVRVDPGRVLDVMLGPAREPGARSAARVETYRQLVHAIEGKLNDWSFAKALHGRWIDLTLIESLRAAPAPLLDRRQK